MHFSEVASAEQFAYGELLLKVEQDDEPLHRIDPGVPHLRLIQIELDGAALGHHDEAVEVLLRRVLKMMLLQPAVLHIEDGPLLRICLVLRQ